MTFYRPKPEWNGQLSAYDFFSMPVILSWEDGSICSFQHAFYRYEPQRDISESKNPSQIVDQHIAVYTEHCGYHTFNKHTKVIAGDDRSHFGSYQEWRANREDKEWLEKHYGF